MTESKVPTYDPMVKPEGAGKHAWDYITDDNVLFLQANDMTEDNMHKYVEKMREFRPRFIYAYPSALEILAKDVQR